MILSFGGGAGGFRRRVAATNVRPLENGSPAYGGLRQIVLRPAGWFNHAVEKEL